MNDKMAPPDQVSLVRWGHFLRLGCAYPESNRDSPRSEAAR
jgi:hypothetical protein